MNELLNAFVHEHKVMTVLLCITAILAVVGAVGTYYFDWDLIQMAIDTKDKIIDWAYVPFNRSFDGIKSFALDW